MRESLADMAIRNIEAYHTEESREAWILNWPGQMVLCGSQYHWTMEVEAAIEKGGAKGIVEYVKQMNKQLDNVTSLARDPTLVRFHTIRDARI